VRERSHAGSGVQEVVAAHEAGLGAGSLTARMADASSSDAAAPRECTACRGTGQVISNLGGSPHQVTCPWCEGTGRFIPGHDAQAARRSEEGSA
jgi:DnaJ-class molecular chaperone